MDKLARFIKTEQDGVEFYTIAATGESGMSLTGLVRLCGLQETRRVSELLERTQNSVCGESLPDSLKAIHSKPFEFAVRGDKNARIVKAEPCASIIEYYAFDAKNPTEKAKFAFRKFATSGINVWIQRINGWRQSEPRFKSVAAEIEEEKEFTLYVAKTLVRGIMNREEKIQELDAQVEVLTAKLELMNQEYKEKLIQRVKNELAVIKDATIFSDSLMDELRNL